MALNNMQEGNAESVTEVTFTRCKDGVLAVSLGPASFKLNIIFGMEARST